MLNGAAMDYYDYVRAKLAGGKLEFDPLKEVHDMVDSNCADLHYRADAVTLAIKAGMMNEPQPGALPSNIYGTEGDWETYSSPSRDARLKTAFKELRDQAARFLAMYQANDPRLKYKGQNLAVDMLTTYDRDGRAVQDHLCPHRRLADHASAMRRRAGGCSRCRSIPITASSGAGARAIRASSPAVRTAPTSAPGMPPNRACATSSNAPTTCR